METNLKYKIVFFYVQINVLLSKIIFHSQALFTQVLKDEIYSKIFRLSKKFEPILDREAIDLSVKYDESLEVQRGNSSLDFSKAYWLDNIPVEFNKIIESHRNVIEKYLGKKFCYENVLVFRNLNFDARFEKFDVYSNVWHQDSHDGNRLIKIFILLEDVDLKTGPFRFLPIETVNSNWLKLCERGSSDATNSLNIFNDAIAFTGRAGTYAVLDTARHMHRGSIPTTKRDMMAITLYPKWRKSKSRRTFNLT